MALDGITIKALVHELEETLVGGKIDKINQPEKDEVLLTIRNQGKNHKLLLSTNPSNPRLYLVENYKKENPLQAPMFLMLLRKHLGGGRILAVSQNQLDRHIFIDIEAYDELRRLKTKSLSIEIMGKHSNMILIDKESGQIIDSIKRVPFSMSSVRVVLPNTSFTMPPAQDKHDPLSPMDLSGFTDLLKTKSQPVFKAIYTNFLGISPILAKQICYMASLNDSHGVYDLTETEFEILKIQFDSLFSKVREGQFSPCLVLDKLETPLDFSSVMLTVYDDQATVTRMDSISQAAEKYYYGKDLNERILQKTQGLRKSLQIKLDRVRSKLQKQADEINQAQNLDEFAKTGELLTANIYQLSKGMSQVEVIDYLADNEMITIALNPNLSPSENIQEYYKKYNKAKSRIKELTEHLKETKSEMDYLENVFVSINNIDSLDAIEDIKEEMAREGYYAQSSSRKQKSKSQSEPLTFISSDGTLILVGKNNTQNDRLTLKISSPNDVWLHTKDIPGSHVIVKATFDDVSKETLYEAGMLAAYYSKSRTSAQVPVDYAPRKNVKKPNGAKPGMVIYDDYGTIYVTPREEELPQRFHAANEETNGKD